MPGQLRGLHEVVADLARSRPHAPALKADGHTVTYVELDRRADLWSADLVSSGVRRGQVVPVVMVRGTDLVITMLAVLKAGAAYALLDPAWPVERLEQTCGRLDSPLIVVGAGAPRATWPKRVWSPGGSSGRHVDRRPVPVAGDDPCCVFFTSGTTGTPKGVLTTHLATARLFESDELGDLGERTVFPVGAPTPWDAFSLELWGPLLNGGTALVDDEPYITGEYLRRAVRAHGATATWLTSSLFNMIVEEDLDAFTGLVKVIIGGEALARRQVGRFLAAHPGIALFNGYGPVESTVFATMHRIRPQDCELPDGIPLGRPVPRTQIYVLRGDQPCGAGETGEICIGGAGLAVGYLGDPALTAEKFVEVCLNRRSVRVYRTGDLGFKDEDGILHFRGRADRQIKVRGHRIEPVALERRLESLLPIRSCRMVPRQGPDGRPDGLIAFCVPLRAGDPLAGAGEIIRRTFAGYERPAAVISVDALPLTANGKVDEAKLLVSAAGVGGPGRPSPDRPGPARDERARMVADVFRSLLGVPEVSYGDSFFDLGGSSLDAGRACARLARHTGRPVPLSKLYQQPTPAGLASWLAATADEESRGRVAAGGSAVPLTPMQTLFLTRGLMSAADRTNHCILTWVIHGALSRTALRSAIGAVHDRHESLRAAYVMGRDPHAVTVEIPPPPLEELGAAADVPGGVAAIRAAFDEDLDPAVADLWRVALLPVSEDAWVLGVVVHHVAFDGWSESVLATHLADAYNLARSGRPVHTAPPVPLAALAAGIERPDPDLADQLLLSLKGASDLQWPGSPAPQDQGIALLSHRVSASDLETLDRLARAARTTRFAVLLACCGAALATVTDQRDLVVSTPVRQRVGAGTEQAVGCQLSLVFLRLRDEALGGDTAAVRAITDIVDLAMRTQDVPVTSVLDAVERPRSSRPPLAQALFAVQDNPVPRLDLDGARTEFVRQPYLDLPVELHAELWCEDDGSARLDVAFRRESVTTATATSVARAFLDNVETMAARFRGDGRG
ncbi:AMP-binding protein [Actinoplanes sp. NPDC049599]|uniref:AMP-binding protein n=1 Tax=Actinoplanes sp. NPDC049599 TaxID=3363903 RepID=UPI003795B277